MMDGALKAPIGQVKSSQRIDERTSFRYHFYFTLNPKDDSCLSTILRKFPVVSIERFTDTFFDFPHSGLITNNRWLRKRRWDGRLKGDALSLKTYNASSGETPVMFDEKTDEKTIDAVLEWYVKRGLSLASIATLPTTRYTLAQPESRCQLYIDVVELRNTGVENEFLVVGATSFTKLEFGREIKKQLEALTIFPVERKVLFFLAGGKYHAGRYKVDPLSNHLLHVNNGGSDKEQILNWLFIVHGGKYTMYATHFEELSVYELTCMTKEELVVLLRNRDDASNLHEAILVSHALGTCHI
jgi:hypothetical protein